MDIIHSLRHEFGWQTLQTYRLYERRVSTVKRLHNQIGFLKDCIEEHVIPKTFGHISRPAFDGSPFPEYAKLFLGDQILRAKSHKEDLLLELR